MKRLLFAFAVCNILIACVTGLYYDLEADHVRKQWNSLGPANPEERITLQVFLKQRNLDVLEEKVWEVSDPESPHYTNYLSVEEVAELVGATDATINTITKVLKISPSDVSLVQTRDAMVVRVPVKHAEAVFEVTLHRFIHKSSGRVVIRSVEGEYNVPHILQNHIHLIRGISEFPLSQNKAKAPQNERMITNSSSTWLGVRGVNDVFKITLAPTCYNGNTSATLPPCSDHPPTLSYTVISGATSNVVNKDFSYPITNPSCQVVSGQTQCTFTVQASTYDMYNLSVSFMYDDGTVSNSFEYGFPVVATPEILPQTIKTLYNIPQHLQVLNPNITQCVVEFEQQYYSPSDLTWFFNEVGLPTSAPVTVIGPNYQNNPGVEANLDIQYIMALAPGAPTTFWSIAANSTIEIDDILSWALAMSNTTNPPLVNSLSYGMTETHVDKYLGKGYLARSDIEFQKLAVRGITIIIADGDSGSVDLGPDPMSQQQCKPLHADWPSQSPYVTAVSATFITPNAEPICYLPQNKGGVNCDELPVGEVPTGVPYGMPWTTGGGFSNTTKRPSYQEAFVNKYLHILQKTNRLPPSSYFNVWGRAYPDVSAVGHNLAVAFNGSFMHVDGTSASAPVFAGIVSLLNYERSLVGKKPLGFLNPVLYKVASQNPEAFNDVVVGQNNCGDVGFNPTCCDYGWYATEGFDAVSGLGTPNYPELKNAVLSFP